MKVQVFVNRVTDESTLAFILRLYRQDNKAGFIKAFSDSPDHCTGRYSHLDRIMRNLFIKNLYVWPRYVHCVVCTDAVSVAQGRTICQHICRISAVLFYILVYMLVLTFCILRIDSMLLWLLLYLFTRCSAVCICNM